MLSEEFAQYIGSVRRYSVRTQTIYADVISDFIGYVGSGSDAELVASLNPTTIRNYEFHLVEERKFSPKTVNQYLSVLSGWCKWLIGKSLLKSNPVRLVKRPKCESRLPEFFRQESMQEYFERTASAADGESLQMLLNSAGAIQDGASKSSSEYKLVSDLYNRRLRRLIISILYETGIRRAELIGLKVGSIDFGRKVISVHGKGDKMRKIPLTDSLSEEISLYLKTVETVVAKSMTPESTLLLTMSGKPLYPVFVDRAVKSELGQIDGVTCRKSPHVLRHTLATELLDEGSDLYSIKELLGHSSLAATQVYTHNTIEKLKNVYLNAHPRAKRGGKNGD